MKKNLFTLFPFIFCINVVFAFQNYSDTLSFTNSQKIKIDSLAISGNEVTKEFIILREMNIEKGDSVTAGDLNYNKERIYSLGLFSKVELFVTKPDSANILNINLKETWYIFPLPIFEAKSHSFDKLSYGVRLLYRNFRGRNETISAQFTLGYDPGLEVLYNNPVFLGENLKFSVGYINSKISNKNKYYEYLNKGNFDYRANIFSISLGKRINQFNDAYLTLRYTNLNSPVYYSGLTASGNKIESYISGSLSYIFDSRDLVQQPARGSYLLTDFSYCGWGINNTNFGSVTLDFRQYYELMNKFIFKYRIANRSTFGELIPSHYKSFLGVGNYVRGHKNDYSEGNNFMTGTAELNYYAVKEWILKVKLPLIPEKLTTARIGIVFKSFFDIGKTFNRYSDLFETGKSQYGYGVGINILFLPHNAIRCDYAFNRYGKGEFIFAAGFSF